MPMTLRTAVPSPKGTNLERLYFTKQPVALDQAPDDIAARASALAALVSSLTPEEKVMLRAMLESDDDAAADPAPTPGMDAMLRSDPDHGKSFEERFPGLKRLLPR